VSVYRGRYTCTRVWVYKGCRSVYTGVATPVHRDTCTGVATPVYTERHLCVGVYRCRYAVCEYIQASRCVYRCRYTCIHSHTVCEQGHWRTYEFCYVCMWLGYTHMCCIYRRLCYDSMRDYIHAEYMCIRVYRCRHVCEQSTDVYMYFLTYMCVLYTQMYTEI